MKKLTSILLALVLLCSCIPAFAVSNCSASYKDGVLYYSCDGDTQIEVWLDNSPIDSKAGNHIEGKKTVKLSTGFHNVTFADVLNSKTVTVAVGSDGSTICTHDYAKNPSKISTSTTYQPSASDPNVHIITTTKVGKYACKLCDETKDASIGTTTSTESHKLSSATDTTCDRCNATISYDVTTKVTMVELSESGTVNLAIGDTLVLGTTLTPSNGAIALKWSSSSSYASVDQNGVVTAKKAGTATITVKTANGKKDTVKVAVYDPNKVASVTLYQGDTKLGSSLSLPLGSSLTLTGVIAPTTAEGKFTWKTAYSKYVTVSGSDENAVITGKAVGSSTIKVTAGGKSDSVKVTVYDPKVATKIELDKSGTYIMGIGETLQLGTTLTPSTAVTTTKWSSSKAKYASVDENGLVTALAKGSTTITVKTANGKMDTVTIKVVDPNVVAAVKLNKSGTISLKVGETLQLTPTYGPSTAAAPSYKWKSAYPKYATVDENGLVTAVKAGKTVTIKVTTDNGKTASVKVKTVK